MKLSEKFTTLATAAKQHIKETDVHTVQKMLASQEPFVLVDVREQNEWANGHLPNAIHLSKGVIERDIEGQVSDLDSTIVLYCGGGFRSALAAENLQKMGYKNVLSMDGGFRAWSSAKFEVEKD